MDHFLENLLKFDNDPRRLMSNEWARFESFKNFPSMSDVSGMRLAQAGFYYSGTGEEAICFCCCLRNTVWNHGETVAEIHKRLSPNCDFVTGKDHKNIPITFSVNTKDIVVKTKASHESIEIKPFESNSGNIAQIELAISQDNHADREGTQTLTNNLNRFSLGTPHALPKQPMYPQYDLKAARISSFVEWEYSHVVNPELLSDAGLFYTGVDDCVRCFFCGGGLKKWEIGDDPMVEHGKFYPNCPYVTACKGKPLIIMRRTNTRAAEQSRQNDAHDRNIVLNNDMVSDVTVCILELGFKQDDVITGITLYRKHYGSAPLRFYELLDIIVENQDFIALSDTEANSRQSFYTHMKRPCNSQTRPLENSVTSWKKMGKTQTILSSEFISLLEENRVLREMALACKICLDRPACVMFLPCGHMVSCSECAQLLRKCTKCRQIISDAVRVFSA